jgi:amicyanin
MADMKKSMIIISLLCAFILMTSVFIAGCYRVRPSAETTPAVPENPSEAVSPSSSASGQIHDVAISGFAFSPAELSIKAGDTVTWTNEDSAPHTIISDSGNEIGSETLSNGQTYSHTFNTAGTFDYHCSIHKSMKAKIIVG